MALSFPLDLATFFDPLPVATASFTLGDNRTFSETGGGEIIAAARGARLWQGEVQIDIDSHAQIAAFEAKIALLQQAGASLLIYDRRKPYPSSDPNGAQLAGASPTFQGVAGNNREIDLAGLPAGYELRAGDLIGWSYGSDPTRRAVHRIVTGGYADGGGDLEGIEVVPFVRAGVTIGTAVTLVKPSVTARLSQADYGRGRSVVTQGGRFSWIQTLR